jgi:hypothetical protein
MNWSKAIVLAIFAVIALWSNPGSGHCPNRVVLNAPIERIDAVATSSQPRPQPSLSQDPPFLTSLSTIPSLAAP